ETTYGKSSRNIEFLTSSFLGNFMRRLVAVTTEQPPEIRAHLLFRVQIRTWPENATNFVKRRLPMAKSNSVPLIPMVAVGVRRSYTALGLRPDKNRNVPPRA
ncbi:MAG: hypothetical protein ABJJ37_27570, partial [Roseibium sp.]